MKQFVKALDKTGDCFRYLNKDFANLPEGKMKEDMFVGPDIRRLMKDNKISEHMKLIEKDAWVCFKGVSQKFLGNYKDPNYSMIDE